MVISVAVLTVRWFLFYIYRLCDLFANASLHRVLVFDGWFSPSSVSKSWVKCGDVLLHFCKFTIQVNGLQW